MSISLQTLVNDTRVLSDTVNNYAAITDANVAMLVSDAGSELYDEFTAQNQHYNIKLFDFTLSGGVGDADGINSKLLPDDFQQGHGLELNPGTATPISVKALDNWLDRNQGNNWGYLAFTPGPVTPRNYCFSGSILKVFPVQNAAGQYRLYYTPLWTPLALSSTVTAGTAEISTPIVSGHTGITGGLTFKANDLTPANVFLPTDVGNFLNFAGCTNPTNDGSWTIGGPGVISANEVGFAVTTGLISETFPDNAVVNLFRQSFVTAAGTWTFYGANQFTQTTSAISPGDTITVTGAANAGNNGTFTVLSVGLNTVTTATTGLVTENFVTGNVSVTAQPAGTLSTLPLQMNSWDLYMKVHAAIAIKTKRDQNVDALEAKLGGLKARILSILTNRREEPSQPPLTRGCGYGVSGGWDY